MIIYPFPYMVILIILALKQISPLSYSSESYANKI